MVSRIAEFGAEIGRKRDTTLVMMSASDQATCFELLPKVSRSFALAIQALPEPERDYICVAYLLCRIVDTVEDHPSLPEKSEYYKAFDTQVGSDTLQTETVEFLKGMSPPPPQSWDADLMKSCRSVFQYYLSFPKPVRAAMAPHILEMSRGMKGYTDRTQDGGRIVLKSSQDLDQYCFYVAGTVGNLLTDVFALRLTADQRWAEVQKQRGYHFALGLQKVNMIKDVAADLARGSLFVPEEWLRRFQVTPSDLLQGENNPRVRTLLKHFILETVTHLDLARDYILNIPADERGLRLFCIWPYVMALDTMLVALSKDKLFTKDHEIKVTRAQMKTMMAMTSVLAGFDFGLKLLIHLRLSQLKESAWNL